MTMRALPLAIAATLSLAPSAHAAEDPSPPTSGGLVCEIADYVAFKPSGPPTTVVFTFLPGGRIKREGAKDSLPLYVTEQEYTLGDIPTLSAEAMIYAATIDRVTGDYEWFASVSSPDKEYAGVIHRAGKCKPKL